MKNKKGSQSLAIVFLVIATLVLSGYTLFRFNVGSSFIQESFDSFSVFEEENQGLTSLKEIFYLTGESLVAEEYEKFAQQGGYINGKRIIKGQAYPGFTGVWDDSRISKDFSPLLDSAFKQRGREFNLLNADKLNKEIGIWFEKDLKIDYSFGKIFVKFPQDKPKASLSEEIVVRRISPLIVEYDLRKIGLHGFKEIFSAKEKCSAQKSEREIQDCFNEELFNFNVVCRDFVWENGKAKSFVVEIESKREFFIQNQMRKIKFGFVK